MPAHRINERIRSPQVRVVGEGITPGVYALEAALKMAQDRQLDLVEIAPKAEPPVCKIVNYEKFSYEQKKKKKVIKANAHKVVIKQIRFTPSTGAHDIDFKARHAKKFLEEGAQVSAYVFFRGRSIVFKGHGRMVLDNFVKAVEGYGTLEGPPKMEGKRMIIKILPEKSKK